MSNTRKQKFGQLIQEVIAEKLTQVLALELPKNALITVSHVEVTVDLGIAFVYLSIFPFEKGEEIMNIVENNQGKIRGIIGSELGKQIRRIPELLFRQDESLEKLGELDREMKGKGNNPKL